MSVRGLNAAAARAWGRVGTGFLPFADVASPELPLGRLLRLSLFQVTVGMAVTVVAWLVREALRRRTG